MLNIDNRLGCCNSCENQLVKLKITSLMAGYNICNAKIPIFLVESSQTYAYVVITLVLMKQNCSSISKNKTRK